MGGFAKLYFCSFPNVVQSARRCMWEKDSEEDSFSHIHLRTACTPLGKTAKASQIRPPKLTNISVKALLKAVAPLPHPAEFQKLCIGDGKLRYFSLWKRVANPILFWIFKIVFRPNFISLDKKYAFFALLRYQCERLDFTNVCHNGGSDFLWSCGVSAKVLSRYILFINSRIRSGCNTFPLETDLSLPPPIHSFRDSGRHRTRVASDRVALTEMIVSSDGQFCDAFAVF